MKRTKKKILGLTNQIIWQQYERERERETKKKSRIEKSMMTNLLG